MLVGTLPPFLSLAQVLFDRSMGGDTISCDIIWYFLLEPSSTRKLFTYAKVIHGKL